MNEIYSSALVALMTLVLVAACNDPPPAKSPDLGAPAARAPSVNAGDIHGPQVNGPSVNLHVDTKDQADAGRNDK